MTFHNMPQDIQKQIDQLRSDIEALNSEYYTNNFTASQDFNKHSRFNTRLRVPVFATAPTVASIGDVYANATNGKLYVCTSANNWTLVGTQT